MKRLNRDMHVFTLEPNVKAAIAVTSGEELIVETWDAFHGQRNPEILSSMDQVCPATGPIWINDAEPGDSIKVDILDIKIQGDPLHFASPGRGFIPENLERIHAVSMPVENDALTLPAGIKIPVRPSLGFIATTPKLPHRTSVDSGAYGGDIDLKELVSGSSIYLPVLVEGGLLVLGDCHAVVGDGAIGGTGAECSAELRLRIKLEKHRKIKRPRALTPDYFITIAPGPNVSKAMRQGVQDMINFLVQEKNMDLYDAYGLLSLAGDVRVSRIFRPISPVKVLLSRQVLSQLG